VEKARLRARLREIELRIEAAVIRVDEQRRRLQKIPIERGDHAIAQSLLETLEEALAAMRIFERALRNALAFNSAFESREHEVVRHGRAYRDEGNVRRITHRPLTGRRLRLRACLYADKRCRPINGGVASSTFARRRLQNLSLMGSRRRAG